MQNIYIKTSIAILLSAFLVACSGGGGSSSQSAPIANNLIAAPASSANGSKVDSSAVTNLKEKEALQKAEAERKARLEKEKADKEKAEKESTENTIVDESNTMSDQPAAPQPEPEPVVGAPEPLNYDGYSISLDGSKNAWNGKTGDYEVKKEGDGFKPSITSGVSNLQIGDIKLELIDPNDIDLGYYGYVSTFTPDNGGVGEESGQKRAVDLLYAYDTNRKDTTAPTLDGYTGTVTYSGNFYYRADTDQVNQANIELNYKPSEKTMLGKIRDNKGIDLDLKSAGNLSGDFTMLVTPTTANTSEKVNERGHLNGQFLDQGKYIVGDAKSDDVNKQWQGVFSTKETGRVAK